MIANSVCIQAASTTFTSAQGAVKRNAAQNVSFDSEWEDETNKHICIPHVCKALRVKEYYLFTKLPDLIAIRAHNDDACC